MWGELVEDVLRRLDAEEKLPAAVSSLVLASLLGEIEECLGGQPPERPSPDVIQSAKPVRAYIDSIEAEGFRGIGPRKKLSLTPGPGLTLVVGRNGSGKSSFAEALELLLTGDNQRWSSRRTKIWREGWRNLHTSDGTSLEARLLIDGEAGPYVVSRTWGADEDLDDGEASVVHNTKSSPLSELGWEEPLANYRPFLSYNELGSMLEDGPSKLFDALASILGLEELVRASDALKDSRSRRSQAHGAVKDSLKALRAGLEAHDDERAATCLELLKGTKWKLEELEELVAGGTGTAPDDTQLAALRDLAQLTAPDPETITKAARELRDALEERAALAGTDTEKARRFADILEKALEIHEHHGDGECPVCGRSSALTEPWRKRAEEEIQTLREKAAAADAAVRRLVEAERRARDPIKPPPAVLNRIQLPHSEIVQKCWEDFLPGEPDLRR